jgi:DNA-directed RNA polymerase subunit F
MTNPTANPLGAGGDVTKAAEKIRDLNLLEPEGQPEEGQAAPAEANPQAPAPEEAQPSTPPRDEKGRFTSEEGTEEPETEVVAEEATEDAVESEPTDDEAELADTIDGLAEQLGISQEEALDYFKATAKINGEEQQVTLRDLINGHQMEADYRHKTADLAEQRRAFEAEQQALNQQREHHAQQLVPLMQQLEGMIVTDDQVLQQLLNDGDIIEFERVKMQADQRKAQLNLAHQEMQRVEHERQQQGQAQMQREIADNERYLAQHRPDWAKNPEQGRKEIAEVRQYLKDTGVPEQVVEQLYDARSILVAEKAMKWDRLQREKSAQLTKAKKAPKKFQKPGASKPAVDPKKKVLASTLNRLKKTGDHRDAAAAIRAMGLVD